MKLELDAHYLERSGVDLTTDDLRLGLSLGIITPTTVVAHVRKSGLSRPLDSVQRRLAELDGSAVADVREILGSVDPEEATLEPASSVRKWLYLELLAAYELRAQLRDPFEFVEVIYADFGYPDSVAPFVRYMPLAEGEEGGLEAMTASWEKYLMREATALAGPESWPRNRA